MNKRLTFLLLFLSIQLVACNTINGVGKDIEKGGKAISHEAARAKAKM